MYEPLLSISTFFLLLNFTNEFLHGLLSPKILGFQIGHARADKKVNDAKVGSNLIVGGLRHWLKKSILMGQKGNILKKGFP